MLEISGGCFSVRLIRELDVIPFLYLFLGGVSYTRKYTVYKANIISLLTTHINLNVSINL